MMTFPFETFITTILGSNQYNVKTYKNVLNTEMMKICSVSEQPSIYRLRNNSYFYHKFSLTLVFYLGNKNYDIDNLCKSTIDVLKFYMGSDDMAIYSLRARKIGHKKKSGVYIKIKEIK